MNLEEEDKTFVSLEVWDEDGKYSLSVNLDDKQCYYMPHFEIYSTTLPPIPPNTAINEIMSYMEMDIEIPEIWDNDNFLFEVLYPTCDLYVKYGKTLPKNLFTEVAICEYNKNLYDITETIPREDLYRVLNVFDKFFKMCKQFNLTLEKTIIPVLNDSNNSDTE